MRTKLQPWWFLNCSKKSAPETNFVLKRAFQLSSSELQTHIVVVDETFFLISPVQFSEANWAPREEGNSVDWVWKWAYELELWGPESGQSCVQGLTSHYSLAIEFTCSFEHCLENWNFAGWALPGRVFFFFFCFQRAILFACELCPSKRHEFLEEIM